MNEFKKNVNNLIVYWTPEDENTWYTFSLSYREDFFVKDHKLTRNNHEFPFSFIPESNSNIEYNGKLYMDLSDNSLNITLSTPEKVKEKLYPTGVDPKKPSLEQYNYIMNIKELPYKELFPYIYLQPWPNASTADLKNNFAFCCTNLSSGSSEEGTSCLDPDNGFYKKLIELKTQKDRLGMEKQAVYYINGYNEDKEPVYKNEYMPDLSSLNPFFKNVFILGENLREKKEVTFEELTAEVITHFDSWENLEADLKNSTNKSEQTKIVMSYIALIITFGYDFQWMTNLQIIIITLNLFYKSFPYVNSSQAEESSGTDSEDAESKVPTPGTIHDWIYSTIILPEEIFPLPTITAGSDGDGIAQDKEFVIPYSLGKLKIVKYRLYKYNLGEVSKVESILKGETKTVEERKLSRLEEDENFNQEGSISWNEALDQSFANLKSGNEKTLSQKTSTTTYNNGSGDAIGGWTIDDNPPGGYSKDENKFAKNVVSKAAEIITRKVGYQRVQKRLEEHEEKIVHQYNNQQGENDIIGIYRWISKVYKFQAVEYGNRVMLQIYCINPAENYLKNEIQFYNVSNVYQNEYVNAENIKTPEELGIQTFNDISADPQTDSNGKYYLTALEYYEIADFPSPPGTEFVIEKDIEGIAEVERSFILLPLEYVPTNAQINVALTDKVSGITVKIGGQEKTINETGTVDCPISSSDMDGKQLPIVITALLKDSNGGDIVSIDDNPQNGKSEVLYTAHINTTINIKENVLNEWKYRIFILLKIGYQQKLQNYYRLTHERSLAMSSKNAGLNRDIILQQLKLKCTDVLKKHYTKIINGSLITVKDSDNTDKQNLLIGEPAFLQFIEHSIEWDKLTYYLYPAFENSALYDDNTAGQNFSSFLRSKFARILVPVKNNYQFSFLFSLSTGWLWPGNDSDSPALLENVNVVNQVKNINFAEEESPKGNWEVSIPTSLTILQNGSELPVFTGEE